MAAGNGVALLQVSDFTLAGIDNTLRKVVVEGAVIFAEAVGSVATIAVVAGGTGWLVGDSFTIPGVTGGVGTVATVTGSAVATVTLTQAGFNGKAVTAGAATAIAPSAGTGLTLTTTVTAGALPISITGFSIVANVLTFTANNSLTTGGGQSITVSGFTGAQFYLNGQYTTTSATAKTIVVAKTAPNSSGTLQGLAVLTPNYTTGGIPISYAFIDTMGLPRAIPQVGPLQTPSPILFSSIAGNNTIYEAVTTVTPNLLKILVLGSGGTAEPTGGAAIPADTVRFRAEFVKDGF